MSQVKGENQGMLRGEVLAVPKLSHHNHGVDYYLVPFRVPRLSGAEDVVNLVVSQPQAELWQPGNWLEVGDRLRLEGRLQSRQYHKMVEGERQTRTAYEISIMNLLPQSEEES